MTAPSPDSANSGLPPPSPDSRIGATAYRGGSAAREITGITVQVLVHVPFGVDITDDGVDVSDGGELVDGPPSSRRRLNGDVGNNKNIYVVWKGLSSSAPSRVCYASPSSSSSDPDLQFLHVFSVTLTRDSVDRMRNNFAVLEVWDKSLTAEEDRLVGIVKLSLHQFHLSFRDEGVAKALLSGDAKYPVVAADSFQPIINPVDGLRFG